MPAEATAFGSLDVYLNKNVPLRSDLSAKAVRTAPGQRQVTATFVPLSSSAIPREKLSKNAFDAAYAALFGPGIKEPIDPKFRICP